MKTTENGWNKETIQALLESNDRAVERALLQIYWRQTATEQDVGATVVSNGVGFTSYDAEFMTSLAHGLLDYGHLTTRQMNVCRPRIKKYWRQLLEISKDSPAKTRQCKAEEYRAASNGGEA